MTREEEILQEYEKKLNDLYARANTKSKKKRILYDLINFGIICYEHFGIEKTFEWEQDEEMSKLLEDFSYPFIENTLENKNTHLDISNSVLNTFIELKFNLYQDHGKPIYDVSPYIIQELTFDFLNDYDYELLKKYKEKLENYEIFDVNMLMSTGYAGVTYSMQGLKKNLIFCDNNTNGIFTAATLMHELGHSYEYDTKANCGLKDYGVLMAQSPYSEVSSRFLEYAFLNYLKENKIYSNDTPIALRHYYKTMLEYVYGINIICKTPFLNINKYGYVQINDASVADYARIIKEGLNYYDIPSDLGEEINYKNSFVYGLGALFSIYLYENYKQDPNSFKKEFRNCLINYHHSDLAAFENVGVTPEILVEGNLLKKKLLEVQEV